MNEEEKSSISIMHWGDTTTKEFWNCDVDGDQFTSAFAGLLIASGFPKDCPEQCFQQYLVDRGYVVYKKEEEDGN